MTTCVMIGQCCVMLNFMLECGLEQTSKGSTDIFLKIIFTGDTITQSLGVTNEVMHSKCSHRIACLICKRHQSGWAGAGGSDMRCLLCYRMRGQRLCLYLVPATVYD